jgi:hypothetical protein
MACDHRGTENDRNWRTFHGKHSPLLAIYRAKPSLVADWTNMAREHKARLVPHTLTGAPGVPIADT